MSSRPLRCGLVIAVIGLAVIAFAGASSVDLSPFRSTANSAGAAQLAAVAAPVRPTRHLRWWRQVFRLPTASGSPRPSPATTSTPPAGPTLTPPANAPNVAPSKSAAPATSGSGAPGAPASHGLLAGAPLWVNPNTKAVAQVAALRAAGQTADADQLAKISTQPVATWLASDSSGTLQSLTSVLTAATASGKVPVIVLYDIPGRDCSGYSQGGAASATAYQTWINLVATRIGSARVAVVLEPDAIAQTLQGCASSDRYALLANAVSVLKARPATSVYLDAGNPGWISNVSSLASALVQSGVRSADGFALNVSNFATTSANVTYGNSISAQLGGAHFVIDTSRNGLGPLATGSGYAGPSWCNPPGRALGPRPTTQTGSSNVDAFLWVKPPGESDGDCGLGDPGAGQWWTDYALGLAQRS